MLRLKTAYFILKNILRIPLDKVKKNKIAFTSRISSNSKISNSKIGEYCYIANNTNIVNTEIKNYCSIAPGVQIGGMEHSHWWYSMSTFLSDQCVANKITVIEEDVWIAAGSIIKQGITIGRGSVIGAMSFVNKDVPPNSIMMGIPAKRVRDRLSTDVYMALEKIEYWKYSPRESKEMLYDLLPKS